MERNVILNFISQNYNALINSKIKRMTICLFGIDYSSSKYNNLINGQSLFIFDIKLPRIDKKISQLEDMNTGLLEFSQNIDAMTKLNKDDFVAECDPYSNKLMTDLDFNYVFLFPIIKNDLHQGVIFSYSDIDSSFNYSPASITKLLNDLVNDFDNDINLEISKITNLNNPLVLEHNGKIYQNSDVDVLNNYQKKVANLGFPYTSYKLSYLDDNVSDDISMLHLSMIDKMKYDSSYTIVVVEDYSYERIKRVVQNINQNVLVFNADDDFYVLIFNYKIKNNEVKTYLERFNGYKIIFNCPKDISRKMKLEKIVQFIKAIKPISYDEALYKRYLEVYGQEMMRSNTVVKRLKRVYNSKNNEDIGLLVNYVPDDFKYLDAAATFERRTINLVNEIKNDECDHLFIGLLSSSINIRKMKEIYKKYAAMAKKISLIVHYDKNQSREDFIDAIVSVQGMGIDLYFDSSIYLNFNILDCMSIAKGIYVRKEEFAGLENTKMNLVNLIMSYFMNDKEKIIIELTGIKEKDDNYRHDSIMFVER